MIIKASAALRNDYASISNLARETSEPIYITKNGKVIAKLSNPNQNRVDTAKSLFGILPKDASLEDAKAERLNTK